MGNFGDILSDDVGNVADVGSEPPSTSSRSGGTAKRGGWPKGKKRGTTGKRSGNRSRTADTGQASVRGKPAAAVRAENAKAAYSVADFVKKLSDKAADRYNDHSLRLSDEDAAKCVEIPQAFITAWFPHLEIVLSEKGATAIALVYFMAFTIGTRLMTIQRHRRTEARERAKEDDPVERENVHYMTPLA